MGQTEFDVITGDASDPTWGSANGLAAAAIRGDTDALHLLWERHRRWVAAILLAHKPREADLDDLLQEVAAIVVAKLGDVRDEGALKPWLRTVAISVARTAARKRSRRGHFGEGNGGGANGWLRRVIPFRGEGAGGGGEHDGRPGHVEPGVSAAVQEEGRRLMELARQLPEGYREPLLLKCIRGLSYRQIGELLGLPETTVETRIARGRRMLRELADRASGEGQEPVAAAANAR